MSERPEQLVLPLDEEPEPKGWHEWIVALPLGLASERPDDAEDFERRGLVEPVLRSGWRATPLGLRLSRELARVGVAA